jgi:hypothetical protein
MTPNDEIRAEFFRKHRLELDITWIDVEEHDSQRKAAHKHITSAFSQLTEKAFPYFIDLSIRERETTFENVNIKEARKLMKNDLASKFSKIHLFLIKGESSVDFVDIRTNFIDLVDIRDLTQDSIFDSLAFHITNLLQIIPMSRVTALCESSGVKCTFETNAPSPIQLFKEREEYSKREYILFHLAFSGHIENVEDTQKIVDKWASKPLSEIVNIEDVEEEISHDMLKAMHFPFEFKFAFFLPFLAPITLKYPILLFHFIKFKIKNWRKS